MIIEKNHLYKTDEAAEFLRLHRITVFRLAKSGQIPTVKLGGRNIRFRGDDLLKIAGFQESKEIEK